MKRRTALGLVLVALTPAFAGCADEAPRPEVFFISPPDGATVSSPVQVEMGATDFEVEPAANGLRDGAGHLHIMIDRPCVEARLTVPPDAQHLHFGQGQTEAEFDLPAGKHFLCLQAADANHTALPYTDEIEITVR